MSTSAWKALGRKTLRGGFFCNKVRSREARTLSEAGSRSRSLSLYPSPGGGGKSFSFCYCVRRRVELRALLPWCEVEGGWGPNKNTTRSADAGGATFVWGERQGSHKSCPAAFVGCYISLNESMNFLMPSSFASLLTVVTITW